MNNLCIRYWGISIALKKIIVAQVHRIMGTKCTDRTGLLLSRHGSLWQKAKQFTHELHHTEQDKDKKRSK